MSLKLSVTVRKNLEQKYDAASLGKIDAAIKAWIAADKARAVETVHVALDDAAAMKALGAKAVSGRVTASKAKRAIDALWKKLAPDYLVLLGADDVVPYFVVANPSYSSRDGDDDRTVRTDNPYACSQPYRASKLASYLLPDRVVGRIPDAPYDGDPDWLLSHLGVATHWKPQDAKKYTGAYAICCDGWKAAGRQCVQFIGEKDSSLIISPPDGDGTKLPRSRLRSLLHMIKCHGLQLDASFYGQKGDSYPVALSSASLKKRVKPNTVAGAMCCYGAQLYSPVDPAAKPAGAWPISSTYLRRGAFGFAGSTEIAWVGVDAMACADVIVARYLSAIRGGASQGRAFLEAKQAYLRALQEEGTSPGIDDEKTLVEFVLLGDPSIHPVARVPAITARAPATPARRAGAVAAAAPAKPSPAALAERRQRRLFGAQLASQIRGALPVRTPAKGAARGRATALFRLVQRVLKDGARAGFPLAKQPVRVDRVETTFSKAQIEAAGFAPGRRTAAAAAPARQESFQYYWSGKRVVDGHLQIRLVKVEADAKGQVLRHKVVQSG